MAERLIEEEIQQQGNNDNNRHVFEMEDLEVDQSSSSWCCCFQFGGGRRSQESRSLLQDDGEYVQRESWFVTRLKKLKEFSELVAGPKWKNFIRKFGKNSKPKKFTRTEYMYSPNSYALNFADTRFEEEEDDLFVSFSTRFSAPLSAEKQRPPPPPPPATTSSL
ncbi:OLC1v1033897C1 [Oldenlandia corymbosa var. corymbosa]|uniref:OLC1v1033897C1 n=1 Tax=Oldenlandia corymbosa var. corymbosa TaxID=529605 RepID=A0AAV1CRY2_OLDCO|nr:OLC1v1033897C1 [Oldenlandia corymbosa var. corymbosa]